MDAYYRLHTMWIMMEYCVGTLVDVMNIFGSFGEKELIATIYQLLNGILFVHNKNIIHRDIKGNLIFSTDILM